MKGEDGEENEEDENGKESGNINGENSENGENDSLKKAETVRSPQVNKADKDEANETTEANEASDSFAQKGKAARFIILAAGAAAVTKLCAADGKIIERIFNCKYPYEYISRFDEQIAKKGRVFEFYEENFGRD